MIGANGEPIRIAPPLWDAATRDALIAKTAPKRTGSRAPKGLQLCSGLAFCGVCGTRLYRTGTRAYGCTGRVMGLPGSAQCRPAPTMQVEEMDQRVTAFFLERFGMIDPMQRVFDPGTGHAARIAELEANRKRLRVDREAGLYDSPEDTAWYQGTYMRICGEITQLKTLPDRAAGWHWEKTGRTYAQRWAESPDNSGRRELLARYSVKIVLYPTGHRQGRLWIHTLDPITEAVAIGECERMDREQAEAAAELADLIARQEQPDPEELARMIEDEQEAADQAARQEDEEYEADQADTYEYVD
ncbi:zinc ribbon domain-containing protein [Actinocrinis puniceicyclus]|uniref:Zinc ribbon domain-containing protein n=1 Tax=Actinocrinis puniceicyclus TaxID=977794 RepID=A0A8J8BFU5_9ACTN|nr:zinc ribbon domain-containing protein [Actinocrinis puniceicyclus]MBS2967030.1 zinc ribbon domain-containing protein [Actinocrinis puniceicyclus]